MAQLSRHTDVSSLNTVTFVAGLIHSFILSVSHLFSVSCVFVIIFYFIENIHSTNPPFA